MEKEIIIVAGLCYGDEGKGSIVDYLVRIKKAGVIIRYNGGAQAGHNVVTPEGLHHTFSQFGSGTLIPGAKTFLSRFMIINPIAMLKEEEHLRELGIRNALSFMAIEEMALVTTPFQITANRILQSCNNENSSCGLGVGQTVDDYQKYGDKVLFAKDMKHPSAIKRKLVFMQELNRAKVRHLITQISDEMILKQWKEWLEDQTAVDDLAEFFFNFAGLIKIVADTYLKELIGRNNILIFEGAQGALLDRNFGAYPYITKSNTTFANAVKLIGEAGYDGKVTKLGVFRAYATRHGTGPFPAEENTMQKYLQELHNCENRWQGKFRVGWHDLQTLRYAIKINEGIDGLAITHIDQIARLPEVKIRTDSGFLKFSSIKSYLNFLQSSLGAPINIVSSGPTWKEKRLTE